MVQLAEDQNESSGLGYTDHREIHRPRMIGMTDASLEMKMMVRSSITSSDDGVGLRGGDHRVGNGNLAHKMSDDLTLDMLGEPTTATQMSQRPQNSYPSQGLQQQRQMQEQPYGFIPQITTKNPPSSALNLHAGLEPSDSRGNLNQNHHYGAGAGQSSEPAISLDQYRQNNANLQNILMQFDSTPQFNQIAPTANKYADSAPHSLKVPSGGNLHSRAALGQFGQPSSGDTLNEVSSFTYMQPGYQQQPLVQPQTQQQTAFQQQVQQFHQQRLNVVKPEAADQIDQIRDNLSKIEMLQNAIHSQQPSQPNSNQSSLNRQRQGAPGLQQAGYQIMQNENKNLTNSQYPQLQPTSIQPQHPQQMHQQPMPPAQATSQYLQVDKAKSAPVPDQNVILNQHKQIMSNFDDIPINKIKTMVGYQTNVDMYRVDAKLPPGVEEQQEPNQQQPTTNAHPYNGVKESITQRERGDNSDDSEEGEEGLTLEERLIAPQWKVRQRASKEINQMFYNDYAKSQSDPSHPLQSFDSFGPQLQEMIKDTNLTNAYEALQCLHSYVRFAPDIKQVTFSCHIYLLEKVNTTKSNFREITLKIILCMLRRLQGSQNTILPELLKRFKSKNAKSATFCLQVILEAFKTKEQTIIQEMNLKQLYKAIQTGLTHQNKEIRDAAYQILKFIFERCKDEPASVVQHCLNLRPIQIKELSEDLTKVQKLPNANFSLFDEVAEEIHDVKTKTQKGGVLVNLDGKPDEKTHQEAPSRDTDQEVFDLLTLLPDDFQEIPYTQAINTKKKSMEALNLEMSKIVEKGSHAVVKTKDYSMILNIVFHMLEDKNMLVFMEAIKSVELLTILQQLKKEKVKPFLTVLAGKYGETKTAVIGATDKAMAAIVKYSLTPTVFSDTVINQIAATHKNPRVKQFLLANPLTQMLHTIEHSAIQGVFKTIQKSLSALILKDNNDQVRNAAVQVIVEFGTLMASEDAFQTQLQTLIQLLPKSRILEINKKLNPQPATESPGAPEGFAKTMAPPQKKAALLEAAPAEDEFSKTLEPAKQLTGTPAQFLQTLMRLIKSLPQNTLPASKLQQDFLYALSNEETVKLLVKQRLLITKLTNDVLTTHFKKCLSQKDQVLQIVELLKELYMHDVNQGSTIPLDDLQDFVQVGFMLTELGVDQDTGATSQILVLALEATHKDDYLNFCEMLRTVIELPSIMQATHAIKIISNVYLWLGLKLNEFVRAGMSYTDIEELRGLGIKYLESTHLFSEKQRQQLISVMIRFKDQIQEARSEALQTLGQQVLPSSRSQQSSQVLDQKQQTAQFNRDELQSSREHQKPQITAELICQTIDKEFEQGLLMFKELAQSNGAPLEFDTKEMIFNKLLGIVSEGFSGSQSGSQSAQQQQYRQAYALKALMWMKEETMGLEDTFKLTAQILQVYLMQIKKQIDASVEMYLLNFWVRELSIRDLCDRIQMAVSQTKITQKPGSRQGHHSTKTASEEHLDGFAVLFAWLCEHKLDPTPDEWKLGDLRKVALLICESVLSTKSKAKDVCRSFLNQCVDRDSSEKVLEFMEIQLMHSNEVFIQFLDWYQVQYPKRQPTQQSSRPNLVPLVDVSRAIPEYQMMEQPGSSISQHSASTSAQAFANQMQNDVCQQSTERSVDQQHASYMERRREMKASNMKQQAKIEQSEMQVREITKIEDDSLHQQSVIHEVKPVVQMPSAGKVGSSFMGQGEPRRSRYDEQLNPDNQYFDSIDNDDLDKEILPIEEIKESQTKPRIISAATRGRQNDELQERVQQSEAKQRDWVSKIIQLEAEKRRIEEETTMLKSQSNQESQQWQQRLHEMQAEHQSVIGNLSEVNQCYLQQVDENEQLKAQMSQMQKQNEDLMTRFEQIERKINSREETSRQAKQIKEDNEPPMTPPRSNRGPQHNEHLMNSVAKLQRISDTFCVTDQQIGVSKICELLLSVERNVDGELAKPLISHYCRMRTMDERLSMITAIGDSLSINEDVLLALSVDVYKALLNFLLRAFAHEKERLDTQSLGRGDQRQEQNQVTMESQKLVSRLLNSKDFTASLVSLFQLLREALPSDMQPALPIEEGQYLRVLMRCISRITKALHSESSELIRGFDVLLEMQKIFILCPPENLREDLPSLADFDFVFRGMRDVSDKFIQLQPEKVHSFLGYCETKGGPENAFMKYLRMKAPVR